MYGKSVIITGASRGIGAETARIFADAGASVVLMARNSNAINTLADAIGDRACAVTGDVANFDDMAAAVQTAVTAFGRLDVLINNAGVIAPIAPLATSDPTAWGQAIDINLKGVYHGLRAAMPVMQTQGGGTILTVSSGAAHRALDGWSHYCASKAGAAMLTASAHLEGAAYGLRAMGLSPGTVATQMQHDIRASGINPVSQLDWSDHIPPDWPARALLWMCSAQADPCLGQELSLRDLELRKKVGLT
ncbi:SDR family NAD(P)-dependent oxidoreductase [Roseovarius aestuarii]|nr:SDR family NAD(P)-dependent oxidoreductase [Roseovarius aestuarii]